MAARSASSHRGILIVVEGLDRAGKTSQCQLLVKALEERGHQIKYIKFPDRKTATGKIIDSYLQGRVQQDDHAIHLLFSANRWEAAQEIRSCLLSGITVIVDRYSYSGAVYSAAKGIPGLSLEWAWQPEAGLLRPDLLLFLSISLEETVRRGGYGQELYETDTIQDKVSQLFETLLSMNHGHKIHTIEAGASVEAVAHRVLSHTLAHLTPKTSLDPLGKLRSWRELQTPSPTNS